MSLIYKFSFTPAFAGQSAAVVDAAGAAVTGSPATLDSNGVCSLELDEGTYTATTSNTALGLGSARTAGVLDLAASLAAGGGGTTDGVGAVFFGGADLEAPINNTNVYCDFVVTDDPPGAPQRDDLMTLDAEDDTTLDIVRDGLYDLCLNVPIRLKNIVYGEGEEGSRVDITVDVQFEVNGGIVPPAYDFNNRAYWSVTEDTAQTVPVTVNFTQPQILRAGDTLQLRFKAQQSGLATVAGVAELNPDITMVCTYRGPVDL